MKTYAATVAGVVALQGFTDVYQVTLNVAEMFAGYSPAIPPITLNVGPELAKVYKRLYLEDKPFNIQLPG